MGMCGLVMSFCEPRHQTKEGWILSIGKITGESKGHDNMKESSRVKGVPCDNDQINLCIQKKPGQDNLEKL